MLIFPLFHPTSQSKTEQKQDSMDWEVLYRCIDKIQGYVRPIFVLRNVKISQNLHLYFTRIARHVQLYM